MLCRASKLSRCLRRPRCHQRPVARGFSLVEIMVVVVIIGLLAGMVAVNVRGYLVRARQDVVRGEISNIVKALETFNSAYARYPTMDEGLRTLAVANEKFPDALLTAMPVDPWGREYQYNSPGTSGPYEVICYGKDGAEGGDGENADITSADLKK